MVRRCLPHARRARLPPDAIVTTTAAEASTAAGLAVLLRLVKGEDPCVPGRLPSPDARSVRRRNASPRTRTRHHAGALPPRTRLPTLLRRPGATFWEAGAARPRRFLALFTPGRTRPRVVRRLLPSNRSASTTFGPTIPGLGSELGLRRAPLARSVRGFPSAHPRVSGAVRRPRSRVSSGQGPSGGREQAPVVLPAPSRRDGSRGRLCPNLIDSDTSLSRWPRPRGLENPCGSAVRRRSLDVFVGRAPRLPPARAGLAR